MIDDDSTIAETKTNDATATSAASIGNEDGNEDDNVDGINAASSSFLCFLFRASFSMPFIAQHLGIDQTTQLMTTCTDIYNEDLVLYWAPKQWTNHNDVRKLIRAMVLMSPRWRTWICTSKVEKITLGVPSVDDGSGKANVVSDECLRFIAQSGKFPRLKSVDLWGCTQITGASVIDIARACPLLTTINLGDGGASDRLATRVRALLNKDNITASELAEMEYGFKTLFGEASNFLVMCEYLLRGGGGCLLAADGGNYSKITDPCIVEIAQRCPQLTCIGLECCSNITNASVIEIAKGCPQLTSINLNWCENITNASIIEIAHRCPHLTTITIRGCSNITDASVIEIAKGCPQLTSIDLQECSGLTDASVVEIAQGCPKLVSINLSWCENISDASLIEIAHRCPQLTSVYLDWCSTITDVGKNALRQGCPQLIGDV